MEIILEKILTEYVSNNSKLQCLNVSKLEQFGKFFVSNSGLVD